MSRIRPPVNPIFLMITVGAPRSRAGEHVLVVADVHHHAVAQLFEIVDAEGLRALGFGPGQCRQQETGENGDDGDDDQQFDQRKAAATPAVRQSSPF